MVRTHRVLERRVRAVRRMLLPSHVRRDIRDHDLLVALLARELRADADCLDAGAHTGSVLREIVRLAPRGRHVAWEPLPALAAAVRNAFPAVNVREAALADTTGERSFTHVLDDPGWSSLVAARPTPSRGPTETLSVRCERLDDVLPEGIRPALLKIDVEGAETQVLRGAQRTLREHRPLIAFEHGLGSAEYHGTGPEELHGLLDDAGYAISGLDGDGPYDLARFAELFATGERVNFVARPTPAARSHSRARYSLETTLEDRRGGDRNCERTAVG
jgi:FkbM family methyltransferase